MHACMYVSLYLCIYVSISFYLYVSMYVCIYLSMYLCIYLSIYTYRYITGGGVRGVLAREVCAGFDQRSPVCRLLEGQGRVQDLGLGD